MQDVEVWGVDAKPGGVELSRWRKQMGRFATEHEEIVQLLGDAREEITTRGQLMAANGLQTYPVSPERKALVVLVDELAEIPPEAKVILDSIVRMGRAMAVILVCATQRPSASALGELGGNLSARSRRPSGSGSGRRPSRESSSVRRPRPTAGGLIACRRRSRARSCFTTTTTRSRFRPAPRPREAVPETP